MTQSQLVARREALAGLRFHVLFYGAWHVVDEVTERAERVASFEAALTLAEDRNADASQTIYERIMALFDGPATEHDAHVADYYVARHNAEYEQARETLFCIAHDI